MVRGLRPSLTPLKILGPGLAIAACVGSHRRRAAPARAPGRASAPGAPAGGVSGDLDHPGGLRDALAGGVAAAPPHAVRIQQHRPRPPRRHVEPGERVSARPAVRATSRTRPSPSRCRPSWRRATRRPPRRSPTTAVSHLSTIVACDTTAMGEDACATQFIATFGKRAFRRPLTTDEQSGLLALYQANRSGGRLRQRNPVRHRGRPAVGAVPLPAGVRHDEPGAGDGRAAHVVRDGVAPVLLPLGLDARRHALRRRRRRRAQDRRPDRRAGDAPARRPEGAPAVSQFFSEWMGVDRDRERPEGPDRLRDVHAAGAGQAMQQETLAFADWAIWQSDAKLATLLTAPGGVRQPVARAALRPRGRHRTTRSKRCSSTRPSARASSRRRASWRSSARPTGARPSCAESSFARSSSARRSRRRRRTSSSRRPRSWRGSRRARCSSCTRRCSRAKAATRSWIPSGSASRTTTASATGERPTRGSPSTRRGRSRAPTSTATFNGAVDLAHKLAQSSEVRDCVATEWFRYAMGRGEIDRRHVLARVAQAVVLRRRSRTSASSSSPSPRRRPSATATR